jgi:arylsulfatase A-like enzyme
VTSVSYRPGARNGFHFKEVSKGEIMNELSRRMFIERLCASTAGGAVLSHVLNRRTGAQNPMSESAPSAGSRSAPQNSVAWNPPPVLTNPNILVIMVDQMRLPVWLDSDQWAALSTTALPNIVGRIQANSYNFGQYYANGTVCTPSRATLLTGLYAPQTAIYCTSDSGSTPALNPAFPNWGHALPLLNAAYKGNVWWFGKWHLSQNRNANPLSNYGFKTRTYPGGTSPYNPSPDGTANEGTDGGLFNGTTWANDAQIAGDFTGWLQGQAPTPGQPSSPWCVTVSLINPHDITFAPAWLQSNQFPPAQYPLPVYFTPPAGDPPSFYQNLPSPWNFENGQQLMAKPSLQRTLVSYLAKKQGSVSDWVLFLNQYFWLQNFVDAQVGLVLDALSNSKFASNTIVIFLSDHGEYAGSHGLHTKGWAAYDESIRVPFNVQFPKQTGLTEMNQMCCAVDFFGLICDLATNGIGQWKVQYPDLSKRQSMWSFLYNNSSETRLAPAPLGLPYILHTFDEFGPSKENPLSHIVCLRTSHDPNSATSGAKLAFYWEWAKCTTYPDSTPPESEFYDYAPHTTNNTSEMGNDITSQNAAVQSKIASYTQVLGSWEPPGAGLIGTELNAQLVGTGTDGKPLSQALLTAQKRYFNYAFGSGTCTV